MADAIALFDSHLNTISVILAIVGTLFVLGGLVSYNFVKRYIKSVVDSKIEIFTTSDYIEDKIEEELNKKIENMEISIKALNANKEAKV